MADASVGINIIGRDRVSDTLKKIGDNSKTMGDRLNDAAKKAAIVLVGLGAAAFDAAKGAAEDEKAATALAKTLSNVTGATKAQVAATEDYISKTTLATGVADDQLRPSLDRLVRSTKDVAEAQRLQSLALDISAGTGKDLQSVTEALAKAHDGSFTSLKRLGVSLDEGIIKSKDFDAAVQVMSGTFSGQMQAATETSAGKILKFQNAMAEAKETLGYALLPAITAVIDKLSALAPWITENQGLIGAFTLVIGGFAAAIVTVNAAYRAWQATTKAFTAIQAAFNVTLTMNPIGATILAITALGVALVVAYNKIKPFRDGVNAVWNGIKTGAEAAFRAIASVWNRTLGKIRFTIPKWVPGVGGNTWGFPTVALANGGIVTKPTVALIGEAGPEAVVPLNRGGGFGGGVQVIVQGSVISERDLIMKVRDGIAQTMRRQGVTAAALGV